MPEPLSSAPIWPMAAQSDVWLTRDDAGDQPFPRHAGEQRNEDGFMLKAADGSWSARR